MSRSLSGLQALLLGLVVLVGGGLIAAAVFAVGSRQWFGSRTLTVQATFPNVQGGDADMDDNPFLRVTPSSPHRWYFRYQHLYAPDQYVVMVESFAVEAPSGWEPTLNHEHDEYRWCSLGDALELLHWPEVKDGLRVLAARLAAA